MSCRISRSSVGMMKLMIPLYHKLYSPRVKIPGIAHQTKDSDEPDLVASWAPRVQPRESSTQ